MPALLNPLAVRFPLVQLHIERRRRVELAIGPRGLTAPPRHEAVDGLQLRVVGARTSRLAWATRLDRGAVREVWLRLALGVPAPWRSELPADVAVEPQSLPPCDAVATSVRDILIEVERELGSRSRPRARVTVDATARSCVTPHGPARSVRTRRAIVEVAIDARGGRTLLAARVLDISAKAAAAHQRIIRLAPDLLAELALVAGSAAGAAGRSLANRLPVVLAPAAAMVFFHEVVGHAAEGDQVLGGASAFTREMIGTRIASDELTITDSPAAAHGAGGLTLDDEGVAPSPVRLIEHGLVAGFLFDVATGLVGGRGSTGNGRRQDFRSEVSPRMRNLVVQAGTEDPEGLRSGIRHGLFVERFASGRAEFDGRFRLEIAAARHIRRGQLAEQTGPLALGGDSLAALAAIEGLGHDRHVARSPIFCVKRGAVVVTGGAAPSVRLRALEVLA